MSRTKSAYEQLESQVFALIEYGFCNQLKYKQTGFNHEHLADINAGALELYLIDYVATLSVDNDADPREMQTVRNVQNFLDTDAATLTHRLQLMADELHTNYLECLTEAEQIAAALENYEWRL